MHVKYLGLCIILLQEGTRLLCLTGVQGSACGLKRKTCNLLNINIFRLAFFILYIKSSQNRLPNA
jgi:hypothetical protein